MGLEWMAYLTSLKLQIIYISSSIRQSKRALSHNRILLLHSKSWSNQLSSRGPCLGLLKNSQSAVPETKHCSQLRVRVCGGKNSNTYSTVSQEPHLSFWTAQSQILQWPLSYQFHWSNSLYSFRNILFNPIKFRRQVTPTCGC